VFKTPRGQARLRRLGLAAAAAGTAALVAYVLFSRGYVRFIYPSRAELPVRGVDVSHHQGRMDWSGIRAAGYEFAYIKATEGETFRDSAYLRSRDEARRAGLVTGPYHYFTLCTAGRAQALNLLSVQPGDAGPSLPPAVDLELGGNCGERPPRDSVRAEVRRFLAVVDSAYGKPAVLYVTQEFHAEYMDGDTGGHPLWVRSVYHRPRYAGAWTFWQYAATGRLPGVGGLIDLDAFHGTRAEFAALARPPRFSTDAKQDSAAR
jgi:lysozyme